MRYLATAFGFILSFPLFNFTCRAQSVPVTWKNIFTRNNGAYTTALSPDGSTVAFYGSVNEKRGIYLLNTTGNGSPRFLVAGSSPAWFANGQQLVYVADNDIWVTDLTGNTTRLTNSEKDVRAPRPSPDGTQIAFYSGRSGYQDIWLVTTEGLAPPRQLTRNSMAPDDPRYAPAWSPNGSTIAYFSNKNDYWHDDIWLVDVASGEEKQLSTTIMAMSTPVWSPDGSKIALMANAKNEYWYEDLSYVYILEPETGKEYPIDMQVYASDMIFRHTVSWSVDGSSLFFPYHQRGDVHLWRVSVQGGVATRLTHKEGVIQYYHKAASANAFALVRTNPTRGYEVELLRAESGQVQQLTNISTRWDNVQQPVEVSYPSYDSLYIQGFITYPPDFDPKKEYPALVSVHGGGTNSYYKRLTSRSLREQYLTQNGYVVIAVNYRGGSGFGREFQDLGVNDWGNGQAKDAAWAAKYLRQQEWCNGKVGIYGYSYGGITSMAAINRVPDAFDAAVPMAGIYDFADAYTNADRVGKIFTKTGHGGTPEEQPEIYAISNALLRVNRITTPTLLMHGEADVRAPFRQFQLAVEIMEKEGKVYESHSYPGEPHGFRNPENLIDMHQRMEAWFNKYLK